AATRGPRARGGGDGVPLQAEAPAPSLRAGAVGRPAAVRGPAPRRLSGPGPRLERFGDPRWILRARPGRLGRRGRSRRPAGGGRPRHRLVGRPWLAGQRRHPRGPAGGPRAATRPGVSLAGAVAAPGCATAVEEPVRRGLSE